MRNTLLLIAGAGLTLGLTACGGDDLNSPPPVVPEATATPAPTEPPTNVLDLLDGTHQWETEPGDLVLQEVSGGIRYEPTAPGQQLRVILPGSTDLQGARLQFTFDVDATFADSNGDVQTLVQQNFGSFGGFFGGNGCYADDSGFDGGTLEVTFTNCIATGDALNETPPDGSGWRVGIQTAGDATAIAGGITITGATVVLAEEGSPTDPVTIDLTETGGWSVESASSGPTFSDDGVSYTPDNGTQFGAQLRVLIPGPRDMSGTRIQISVQVDQAFLDTGMQLQAVFQYNQGSYDGFFNCAIDSQDLSDGSASADCIANTTSNGEPIVIADGENLRVGVNAYGNYVENVDAVPTTATVTITEIILTPPVP